MAGLLLSAEHLPGLKEAPGFISSTSDNNNQPNTWQAAQYIIEGP